MPAAASRATRARDPDVVPPARVLRAAAGLLILGGLVLATRAEADTIYLTNGRVIHTASVRVEDGRVIFRQFGGEVSIPLSVVGRLVEDDTVEHTVASETGPGGDPGRIPGVTGGVSETPRGSTRAPEASNDSGTRAGLQHPSHRADYWIKRIREVDERIARVQAELDRLPAYDEVDRRLLRFSGQARYFIAERDKWDTLLRRFRRTRRQLLEGARKAGIAPGALREGLRR
jgi:hypothetical protein